MRSVLEFRSYKQYVRYRQDSAERKRGELSRLAEAAGCQRTYLSQVLHSEVQLTPDHAVALADHWHLPETEHLYFCRLVDYERAVTPRLRARIEAELDDLRQKAENLSERYSRKPTFSAENQITYYSAWHWMAIHVIASIPAYQEAGAIAVRLELPVETVNACLLKLRDMGLLANEGERWVYAGGSMHLPKTSPLTAVNHRNWRGRAVEKVQRGREDGIHYTSTFSMSRADYSGLKARILGFLDDCRATIEPSKEEELVALNLDFFVV